jgi:hypothetical protein
MRLYWRPVGCPAGSLSTRRLVGPNPKHCRKLTLYSLVMRTRQWKGLITFGVVLILLGGLGLLLFDGDLDFGGHYEILQSVPFSSNRIAFEIERTDGQALSGPRYSVLVSDHMPTRLEMKHSMISFWRHTFSLADQRVSIRWKGPNLLNLTATTPGSSPDWVINQKHQIDDVTIIYAGQP